MNREELLAKAKRISLTAMGNPPLATEVSPGLWVGREGSCEKFDGAVVHACKWPCFEKARDGWRDGWIEDGRHLYLNMYDPPYVIDQMWAFRKVLEWCRGRDKLLIHCNLGRSRSPSLMMALMRSRGLLEGSDYDSAWKSFAELYPAYNPSFGMRFWLLDHWKEIACDT